MVAALAQACHLLMDHCERALPHSWFLFLLPLPCSHLFSIPLNFLPEMQNWSCFSSTQKVLYYFPSPIGWSRTRPRCLYISPCLECLSFICLDNLFVLQNPVYVTPSVMLSLIPSDTVNHCSLSVISVLPITLHNVGSVIYRTFSFLPSLRARIMSYFVFVYSTATTMLETSRTSKKVSSN